MDCLLRVDRLTPQLVALMKRAGCIHVYLGLESGSIETLMLMNKRVTVEQGIRAVHLFSQAGIGSAGFFMVGYPKETVESIEKTFALALSLPLDEAWFTIPLPPGDTVIFPCCQSREMGGLGCFKPGEIHIPLGI